MNFDFLQGDFSVGEISPQAQGHVLDEFFKRAVGRAANVAPTRNGSMASRAGGKWLTDPISIGTTGVGQPPIAATVTEQRGSPVYHLSVHNGPHGDFTIEVGPKYIRLMDKFGVKHWHGVPDIILPDGPVAGVPGSSTPPDSWYDLETRTLYMTNSARVLDIFSLSTFDNTIGYPTGTDESWTLSGKLAGDSVTLRVTNLFTLGTNDIVLTRGAFSVNFGVIDSLIAGHSGFKLSIIAPAANPGAAKLWDLKLVKTGMQTISPAITPLAGGRVRATEGFWVNVGGTEEFFVVLTGLSGPYILRWISASGVGLVHPEWVLEPMTYEHIKAWVTGTNYVVGDQRFTINGADIRVYECTTAGVSGAAPGPTGTGTGIADGTAKWDYAPNLTTGDPFAPNDIREAAVYQSRVWFSMGDTQASVRATKVGYGDMNAVTGKFEFEFAAIHNVPHASDALDLKLASPTGRVCWISVLRGLVFGTTRNEKTVQGLTAIDPVTGYAMDLLDHSSVGSDEAMHALSVHEKIVFVQRGRTIVRQASVRFNWESGEPQAGLISEDAGALGEHLTGLKIRSMCFLKGPVPRLVFAFDDGTGAIATLGAVMAWSRFTIPSCYGGIYGVAALDTQENSELWVGTETGITLHWDTFESKVTQKSYVQPPLPWAVTTMTPATKVPYDNKNVLPPVMDGWHHLPGFGKFISGVTDKTQWSRALIGQMVYIMVNGQPYGPYQVKDDGAGSAEITELGTLIVPGGRNDLVVAAGIPFNYLDENGQRQAMDIYFGVAYPEHRMTTLPLEGGNPVGVAQALKSRSPQLYVRFVDSYMPNVNGQVPPERGPADPTDEVGGRTTGDVRCTELGFQRAHVIDIVQNAPLRMEVAAVFGGTQVNNL